MRRISILLLALTIGFVMSANLFAADVDKDAIKKNVDDIVAAIDAGKKAEEFKANDYKPYVFILEEGGMTLVHPTLAGKSLKEAAGPVFEELVKATPEGLWVDYVWKEKQKHTYVRKTKSNLIVGSGYSE